jgi:hypothetical protein
VLHCGNPEAVRCCCRDRILIDVVPMLDYDNDNDNDSDSDSDNDNDNDNVQRRSRNLCAAALGRLLCR